MKTFCVFINFPLLITLLFGGKSSLTLSSSFFLWKSSEYLWSFISYAWLPLFSGWGSLGCSWGPPWMPFLIHSQGHCLPAIHFLLYSIHMILLLVSRVEIHNSIVNCRLQILVYYEFTWLKRTELYWDMFEKYRYLLLFESLLFPPLLLQRNCISTCFR